MPPPRKYPVGATCTEAGCERLIRTAGMCNHHYLLLLKARKLAAGLVCSEPECDLPVRSRGLCGPHYQRWIAAQKPPEERTTMRCRICGRVGAARELCEAHYKRWRLGKDLRLPLRSVAARGAQKGCAEPGCERAYFARGLCRLHYVRVLSQDPGYLERRRINHRESQKMRRQAAKEKAS